MSYSADPSSAQRPLNTREVEQLIESKGKGVVKNARALQHLLGRVQVTMRVQRDQMANLHREVQRAQMDAAHAGAPTTLHPADSFKYLSDEEKKRHMDRHLEEKYDALMGELIAAKQARAEATRLSQGLRFQLVSVLEDPTVPARVKDKITELMEQADRLPEVDLPVDAQRKLAAGGVGQGAAPAPPSPPAPAPTAAADTGSPPAGASLADAAAAAAQAPEPAAPDTPPTADEGAPPVDAAGPDTSPDDADLAFDEWLS